MSTATPPDDWPNRRFSRRVEAAGLHWHVQVLGRGPVILLLHGTGAATHSWAALAPLLARRFTVVAPDLPGHGFTDLAPASGCTLSGMSRAVAALLATLDLQPRFLVGHSAGAAIAASLCLRGSVTPQAVIALNGALLPFGRAAAPIFTRAARALAEMPVFPQLVALHAVPSQPVRRMLHQTGSRPTPDTVRWYREVVRRPRHVTGALRMMANWDLPQLERNLDRLDPPLYLIACSEDLTVSPKQAECLAERLPGAQLIRVPDLGHLGHEEDPERFAALIGEIADAQGR